MASLTSYMTVLEKSESKLRLLREPTFLSKAVFVGFAVGVAGVILFGSETFLFKLMIGVIAVFLSCFMVDNYEICEMNKETSEVHLIRMHFCQYFLGSFLSPRPFVTSKLSDIQDVRVESQESGEVSKKSHRVVLCLTSGIQLGLTEVCTTDDIKDHENIVDVVLAFLGIHNVPNLLTEEEDRDYEGDDSSTSDDGNDPDIDGEEDFEEISKSDIEKLEAEQDHMPGSGDTAEDCAKISEHAKSEA